MEILTVPKFIINDSNTSVFNNLSSTQVEFINHNYNVTGNILYTLVFIIATVWIYSSNIALYAVINKFELLQVPYKIIRLTISSLDMIICTSSVILFPVVVWKGYGTPKLLARICSISGVGAHFSNMIICALLASERYLYIVYPMKYINCVTPRRTCVLIVSTVFLVYVYVIATDLLLERKLYLSRFHNKIADENGGKRVSIFNLLIFILPSFLITCYFVYKLIRLQLQLSSNSTVQGQPKEVEVALSKHRFTRHLKIIILISGSLWFTYIPAHVISLILLAKNSTETIESNDNWEFTLNRICFVILTFASPSINTASQFYIESNLRVGLKKLLGFKDDFCWQKQMKVSIITGVHFKPKRNNKVCVI